jgi:hypothetical protein
MRFKKICASLIKKNIYNDRLFKDTIKAAEAKDDATFAQFRFKPELFVRSRSKATESEERPNPISSENNDANEINANK